MEIRFYHVQKTPLVLATCSLVRKAFDRRMPTVVVGGDSYLMQDLDKTLWSFDPESFIPHVLLEDAQAGGVSEAVQLLSGHNQLTTVLNKGVADTFAVFALNASELHLTQENNAGEEQTIEHWPKMICEVFDGNNSVVVEQARRKWKAYKQLAENAATEESAKAAPAAITLTYWQENPNGGWQQKLAG